MRNDPESEQSTPPKGPQGFDHHERPQGFDDMMGDAENMIQQGLHTLNHWGDEARHILKDRPELVVASVSIAGFMTGLLLRQRKLTTQNTGKLSANPMVMFVAGAVAGFTMGPRVMQQINKTTGEEQSSPQPRIPHP
ncbi:MAG: hypothetical protein ACJ763_03170 [Bdellovibrionia bacterium]